MLAAGAVFKIAGTLPGFRAVWLACSSWREQRIGLCVSGYACQVAALSKAELAAMAEEATVDAYGEDEQAMGFQAMITDNLKVPFVTSVLGVHVTVEDIDLAGDNSILAVCRRGEIRQATRPPGMPVRASSASGAGTPTQARAAVGASAFPPISPGDAW
jgi:hypothetical protein